MTPTTPTPLQVLDGLLKEARQEAATLRIQVRNQDDELKRCHAALAAKARLTSDEAHAVILCIQADLDKRAGENDTPAHDARLRSAMEKLKKRRDASHRRRTRSK